MGYNIEHNLLTKGPLKALKMALEYYNLKEKLIHHSDRGIQYCSQEYTSLLQKKGIEISMTESSNPRDNAIAERINGIIKNEYMKNEDIKDFEKAKIVLSKSIELYNENRPHLSCNMNTPNEIYIKDKEPKKLWKNYYQNINIKRDEKYYSKT